MQPPVATGVDRSSALPQLRHLAATAAGAAVDAIEQHCRHHLRQLYRSRIGVGSAAPACGEVDAATAIRLRVSSEGDIEAAHLGIFTP